MQPQAALSPGRLCCRFRHPGLGDFALGDDRDAVDGDESRLVTLEASPASAAALSETLTFELANGSGDGVNSAETITIDVTATALSPAFEITDGVGTPGGGPQFSATLSDNDAPTLSHDLTVTNAADLFGFAPDDVGAAADLTITGYDFDGLSPDAATLLVDTDGDGASFVDFASLSGGLRLAPDATALLRLAFPRAIAAQDPVLTLFTDQGAALAGDGLDFIVAFDGSGIAVPAPAGGTLLAIGLFLLYRRRRAR